MAVCYQFMLFQAKDVVIKKERKEKKHSVFDSRLRNRNNHRIQICICAQALAWITKTRSLFEVIRLSEHKKKHTSLTWIYETRFEKKKKQTNQIWWYFCEMAPFKRMTWLCPLTYSCDALYDIQWARDKITIDETNDMPSPSPLYTARIRFPV